MKVLRAEDWDSADSRSALRREAAALQRVISPYVAQLLHVDTDADTPYIVMELVEGEPLQGVAPTGGFPRAEAMRIAQQVLSGIAAAHEVHVTHQDLKPGNVLLCDAGVKIIDFGIASVADATTSTSLTLGPSGVGSGTMAWLSPEQIQGQEATEKSDIFAWGLVSAYAATGRNPFGAGRPEAVMYSIVNNSPDLDGIDSDFARPISTALAKDPALRPSARELLGAITAPTSLPSVTASGAGDSSTGRQGTGPVATAHTTTGARGGTDSPREASRWKSWAIGAAAGLLVVAVAGGFVLGRSNSQASPESQPSLEEAPQVSSGQALTGGQRPTSPIPQATVRIGEEFTFPSGMVCTVTRVYYSAVKAAGYRIVNLRMSMRNDGSLRLNSCAMKKAWDTDGHMFRPQTWEDGVNPGKSETEPNWYEIPGEATLTRVAIVSDRGDGSAILDVPPPTG